MPSRFGLQTMLNVANRYIREHSSQFNSKITECVWVFFAVRYECIRDGRWVELNETDRVPNYGVKISVFLLRTQWRPAKRMNRRLRYFTLCARSWKLDENGHCIVQCRNLLFHSGLVVTWYSIRWYIKLTYYIVIIYCSKSVSEITNCRAVSEESDYSMRASENIIGVCGKRINLNMM